MLERDGFEIAGESVDGEDALVAVARFSPDIVLLDIHLPGIDGFEVADRLARDDVVPLVILISSRNPSEFGGLVEARPWLRFLAKSQLTGSAIRGLIG